MFGAFNKLLLVIMIETHKNIIKYVSHIVFYLNFIIYLNVNLWLIFPVRGKSFFYLIVCVLCLFLVEYSISLQSDEQ